MAGRAPGTTSSSPTPCSRTCAPSRACRRKVAAELGRNADHYLHMYSHAHESHDFHDGHAVRDGDTFFNFHFLVDAGPAP